VKRVLATVLVTGLSLIVTPALTATPAAAYENHYTHHQIDTCHMRRNDRFNDAEVRDTIRCAARAFGVSVTKSLNVAWCESKYKTDAYNSGGYAGVYQQSIRYWPPRQNAYDPGRGRWDIRESVRNGRSNVLVSIRMVRRGGWGPWSCA
jgi:hypothetical protein